MNVSGLSSYMNPYMTMAAFVNTAACPVSVGADAKPMRVNRVGKTGEKRYREIMD